ncbi:exodeoxyribonuclease VII small subunit [Sedimentibacter saalensis]|jgi:exodeoxyribonuclease VII small subunit|uniref:Exodeoxyribonuclease VII small subunit n=1 Tax=Sedimentibacter saalensis TaxID=130788 RepID=A0A562JHX7_9FIRM|nr:exodeoxyribonuclease VII small subunit [Sedimentibacter saalensis]MEA5094376.1 exodeoxyribonuclease VII small subunit [Sedimentibacter saalensis]TWH82435.1 exodeoxyribonuclease VII small subunit [Sedimentibacter saalensis]
MKDKYDSFESALEDLKRIVQNFESGEDISIDELLKNYEQGMSAYSYCSRKLEDTQKKIKIIDESYE